MNKKITALLAGMAFCVAAVAQGVTYRDYVAQIEKNNPSLAALKKQYEANIVANKVGLTPPDPEAEFEPMFNGEMELRATQSFAFPTQYIQMSKLAKLNNKKSELDYYANIYIVMQNVNTVFVNAVYYNKKMALLEENYNNALKVERYVAKSFEQGDANVLDNNRAKALVLEAQAQKESAAAEYNAVKRQIEALNNGTPLEIADTNYPIFKIGDEHTFVERALASSYLIRIADADSLIAKRQLTLSKNSWLPNLTVGYKYAYNGQMPSESVNGLVVGISVPLWANNNKVRHARLQYEATVAANRDNRLKQKALFEAMAETYRSNYLNMNKYREYLAGNNSAEAILKALQAGEISVLDYYVEYTAQNAIRLNLLEYERQLFVVSAEMQSYLY